MWTKIHFHDYCIWKRKHVVHSDPYRYIGKLIDYRFWDCLIKSVLLTFLTKNWDQVFRHDFLNTANNHNQEKIYHIWTSKPISCHFVYNEYILYRKTNLFYEKIYKYILFQHDKAQQKHYGKIDLDWHWTIMFPNLKIH